MQAHLYELIQQRANEFPEAIAIGGQEELIWRTLSSRTTLSLVDRLAGELAGAGVSEGNSVVLWVPNHWRTPIYLFALWKLGAIAVPFDHEMNPEAGTQILDTIHPRLIVAGYGERPVWARERELTEWWEPGSRLGAAVDTAGAWSRPAEELAAIFFTSGTTGNPKGCMISHTNLCSQVEALRFTIPLDAGCRLASILPLSHLFELTVGLLYPLSTGSEIHYIPSRRGPDIVRTLSEQRITHMIAVPQLLALMGHALDDQLRAKLPGWLYRSLYEVAGALPFAARRHLFWLVHRKIGGRLRMMASGGAALPAETQRLWERLGVRVVQGYGASECSPVIACGSGDGRTPAGSVGLPLRGVDVRLSTEGELLVRGPNVMRGYWGDPARTAEVLKDG
ncbi:MAG TPA: AMP-binding protein, partial [Dehalococcoidia bacterium]|nr:AMP-binding protein [Dehalococcoidia bacterium]